MSRIAPRPQTVPEPASTARDASRETRWVLVVCCLAFGLRLFRLDAQPLWWDEAISAHLARSPWMDIIADRSANLHPPLYFLLLKCWTGMAGDSPFSLRFLSTFLNVPIVPAFYVFGRRWLGRRSGIIAAVLAACSPLYLYYAQEARVYALLPVVFLALLALTRRLGLSSPRSGWRQWLLLAGVEILALGLHYMSLFAVAYVLVKLAVRLRRQRAGLVRLVAAQGLVALLLSPWLLSVLQHASALGARMGMSNWQAEPVTLAHFVRLLWTFQLTGLTSLVADPVAVGLTSGVALAMAVAVARLLTSPGPRRSLAVLLLDWLIPLASAFLVWRIRPLSHPRYAILFTPALLLLIARALDLLLERSRFERGVAAALAVSLGATFSLGLFVYHTRFAKDDTRSTASVVATHATANDLILVPPEDWSIPYYYDGPGRVAMAWSGDAPAGWEHLSTLTRDTGTVFLVDYYRATRDPRAILPFALESAGSLSNQWRFKGLYVRAYQIGQAVAAPDLSPVSARFGPVQLSGAWIERRPPADTAIPVALRWHLGESTSARLRAALRLRDDAGWTWASADDWLLNEAAAPTDGWGVGHAATTYHLLPLPSGTPPLSYTLTVGVYLVEESTIHPLDLLDEAGAPHGQTFDLGSVSLGPPLGLETDPYRLGNPVARWETPVVADTRLTLAGAALDRTSAAPGQPIYVSLRWVGTQPTSSTQTVLLLEQGGETLLSASAPAGGRYPAERWTAGQTVVEHRRLTIPPAASDGPVQVSLQIGTRHIELGSVDVATGEHLFEPPPIAHELGIRFGDVAELAGYDVENEKRNENANGEIIVTTNNAVTITLYWKALAGASGVDYTVFTHILAPDGHLVGQHDGPPTEGARPTPGWISGEFIVDRHAMVFREAYAGPARVAVGLYDPITMERVPIEGGGTLALLPTMLNVQAHGD
jgi:4-amino-4-deoxy-L-arabinose transferase-like glycosyltransferase